MDTGKRMARMGLFARLENFATNAAPEIKGLIASNNTYEAAEAGIRHWRTQIETPTPVGSVQDEVWKSLRLWMIGWHIPPRDDAEWKNHLRVRFGGESAPRNTDDHNKNLCAAASIAMTIESIRMFLQACKVNPDDQTMPSSQPTAGKHDFIVRKRNPTLTAEIATMLDTFYPTVIQRLGLSATQNGIRAKISKLLGSFVETGAIHAQIQTNRSTSVNMLVGAMIRRRIDLKNKPQEDPGYFMLGQEKIPLRLSHLKMHLLRVEALGTHQKYENTGLSGLAASYLQELWEGNNNLPVVDLSRLQQVP